MECSNNLAMKLNLKVTHYTLVKEYVIRLCLDLHNKLAYYVSAAKTFSTKDCLGASKVSKLGVIIADLEALAAVE